MAGGVKESVTEGMSVQLAPQGTDIPGPSDIRSLSMLSLLPLQLQLSGPHKMLMSGSVPCSAL